MTMTRENGSFRINTVKTLASLPTLIDAICTADLLQLAPLIGLEDVDQPKSAYGQVSVMPYLACDSYVTALPPCDSHPKCLNL